MFNTLSLFIVPVARIVELSITVKKYQQQLKIGNCIFYQNNYNQINPKTLVGRFLKLVNLKCCFRGIYR